MSTTKEDPTTDSILAIFPPGKSLSFGEVCEALGGDWTETWIDVYDEGLICEVIGGDGDYYYRTGDEAAEVDALRRSLADVASDAGHIKLHLERLVALNEKHREALREPQRDLLSILLDDIRRLAP